MQPNKAGMHSKNKISPCRHFILNECKTENCKFRHDEILRKKYHENPQCSNYKRTGSCKFGSKCIFSVFHKNCKFFEINECKKPNCSYYHLPTDRKEFQIKQPIPPRLEIPVIPNMLTTLLNKFRCELENKLKIEIEINQTSSTGSNEQCCVVCLDKKANYVALPCGHLNYCLTCCNLLEDCAICRGKIRQMQRVKY